MEKQIEQHEKFIQDMVISDCKNNAKHSLSCIGESEKILHNGKRTFDFEIKTKNIVFGVTQITLPAKSNPDPDQNENIRNAIKHIGEKRSDVIEISGGVICYNTALAFLADLPSEIQNNDYIIEEMKTYGLNFLLFIPEIASNTNPKDHPKLLYVTKKHKTLFDCLTLKINPIVF